MRSPPRPPHGPPALRDRLAVLVFRGLIAIQRDRPFGPEARPAYDKMIGRTRGAQGVSYQFDTVGGVPGWWCLPSGILETGVLLYLHGGGFVLGSAHAYRYFVGIIASRAGLPAFVADYALAPEHPFPAALNDALAAYRGLVGLGHKRIILAGDSAGAGLTLSLMAKATRDVSLPTPAGAMVMSPLTDLALTGDSILGRAKADPVIRRKMLATTARMYLNGQDPLAPDASPLYGELSALPPTLIHVGGHEILLDDSVRYARKMEEAGGDVSLHIWPGMPHVFPGFVGVLKAASEALDIAAKFIKRLP